MNARMASIALAVLAMGLQVSGPPAFAQQSHPTSARTARKRRRPRPFRKSRARMTPASAAALAASPDAQRLAVQADLIWLGGFDELSADEIDKRMPDAIKAFQRRNSGKDTGVLSDQERAALARSRAGATSRRRLAADRRYRDRRTARRAGEARAARRRRTTRQPLDLGAWSNPDRNVPAARGIAAGFVRTGKEDHAALCRLQRARIRIPSLLPASRT